MANLVSFSIVIPTYNGERFIAQTIESALHQTRPADEIIISDDNSSDSTLDICRKYGDNLKVFSNPTGPSGFVNGWKKAIGHAGSDYICILHQDDLLYPTFLEEIENAIRIHPDSLHFFTPCERIDENNHLISSPNDLCNGKTIRYSGKEYAEAYELSPGHLHRCPGVVTHRDIFKICSYREEAGHIADDDFFLRVGNYTDVVGVMKPLAAYREHSGSETGHLSFLVLNKRLLDDYHYQLSHAKENPLLSEKIISYFKLWRRKSCHRLIIFGIRERQWKFVKYALRNKIFR